MYFPLAVTFLTLPNLKLSESCFQENNHDPSRWCVLSWYTPKTKTRANFWKLMYFLFKCRNQFYLFFSFQGYPIFLFLSFFFFFVILHTTSFFLSFSINQYFIIFKLIWIKHHSRWLILLVSPTLQMVVYDTVMPRLSVAWILKE